MGVDAEMFIRYRGEKPTEHQLMLWSWDMCRAVGAKHFCFNSEQGKPALRLSVAYGDDWKEDKSLSGKEWHQDGATLYAEDGEWFIEAQLATRYYGVGYERGNLPIIITAAQWLEQNIGGEVWYGGDSSGICAEPFGHEQRDALMQHYLGEHGKDYFNYSLMAGQYPTPAPCSLCVPERGMTRFGWGPTYVAVSCGGCGRCFKSNDCGKTWEEEES